MGYKTHCHHPTLHFSFPVTEFPATCHVYSMDTRFFWNSKIHTSLLQLKDVDYIDVTIFFFITWMGKISAQPHTHHCHTDPVLKTTRIWVPRCMYRGIINTLGYAEILPLNVDCMAIIREVHVSSWRTVFKTHCLSKMNELIRGYVETVFTLTVRDWDWSCNSQGAGWHIPKKPQFMHDWNYLFDNYCLMLKAKRRTGKRTVKRFAFIIMVWVEEHQIHVLYQRNNFMNRE